MSEAPLTAETDEVDEGRAGDGFFDCCEVHSSIGHAEDCPLHPTNRATPKAETAQTGVDVAASAKAGCSCAVTCTCGASEHPTKVPHLSFCAMSSRPGKATT